MLDNIHIPFRTLLSNLTLNLYFILYILCFMNFSLWLNEFILRIVKFDLNHYWDISIWIEWILLSMNKYDEKIYRNTLFTFFASLWYYYTVSLFII